MLLASVAGLTAVRSATAAAPNTTGVVGSGFTVTAGDLSFILKQIKIAEAHVQSLTPANPCGTLVGPGPNQIPDYLTSYGLRTVDGSCNNLIAGREKFFAADVPFPRLTAPVFRQAEAADPQFPGPQNPTTRFDDPAGNTVIDSRPRTISNLIVDQTSENPAAVAAANFPVRSQNNPGIFACGQPQAPPPPDCVPPHETLFIPNVTTDVGLSPPFNELFTFFGQFFDHGVDQTVKTAGLMFIPLKADDPLVAGADHVFGTADDLPPNLRFIAMSRAQIQPDGKHDANNTDTPTVDQSQTYTSHSSHQVFLREYALDGNNHPLSTGKLLGGLPAGQTYSGSPDGQTGMATWASVKLQAATKLGLLLRDKDALNIPMIAADPYGNFLPGPARGLPQYVTQTGLVEGDLANPVPVPANVVYFDTPFLTDVNGNANPVADNGSLRSPDGDNVVNSTDQANPTNPAGVYDDELLNAHFIAGDGRVNENIALTTVHQIFHSEHDRLANEFDTVTLPANPDLQAEYKATNCPIGCATNDPALPITFTYGQRLFQAARFVTEMEYQHLVFEEFARKLAPDIRPFHVFSPDINGAIPAEFAHAAYRLGHSMLNDMVDRTTLTDPATNARADNSLTLLKAFLNPPEFFNKGGGAFYTPEEAAGALIMGVSDEVGNEIDEFIVDTLRNHLLGLPLDLATFNLMRGRDTGVPPLNQARRQIFNATNDGQLAPYTSWSDYGQHLKHPESLINFVAAYGTHPSITSQTTYLGKRAAAKAIVDPGFPCDPGSTTTPLGCNPNFVAPPADAADFMFSTGAWAPDASGKTTTGLDEVDLWVGGLAEVTSINGGLLGTTMNYIFQTALENLQDGDRLYYLNRTPGLNLRAQLEANTFSELIERNTTTTNSLKSDAFATADCRFQLANLNGTAAGFAQFGSSVADDPTTTDCNENALLTRSPDGTISYQLINSVDPSGINGQGVYNGTDGVDRIKGGIDNDTLWGGPGNDVLNGSKGDDDFFGGPGNDIETDDTGFDVMRGGPGNDAIDGGLNDDLLLGGDGQDFLNGGANDNEEFAGEGTDFIIGGGGVDGVFGDGGDDWIEGGTGQDLLQGDHGAPFFDDPGELAPGNDVFIGQPGENDYDTEGGDDIMAQNPAIDRNAGAGGFDWAIHTDDTVAADDNMMINQNLAGVPIQVVVNRDRWQETEADSGSRFNDVIKGTSLVIGAPRLVGGLGFQGCDVLDQAGLDRIAGLGALINSDGVGGLQGDVNVPAPDQEGNVSIVQNSASGRCPLSGPYWGDGDIELGGPGSDTLQGLEGDDIIDGDKWLTVRIGVHSPGTGPAGPEIGQAALMEGQATSGDFGPGTAGQTLQALVFAGKVDPGDLSIDRAIVTDPSVGAPDCGAASPTNCDTAVYTGPFSQYTFQVHADGSINVCDTTSITGPVAPIHEPQKGDGCGFGFGPNPDRGDTITNIEQLAFTDQTVSVASIVAANTAAPAVTTTPTAAAGLSFPSTNVGATSAVQSVTVANSGTAPLSITSLSVTGDFAIPAAGGTCSPATPVAVGGSCTVNITFTPTAAGARTGSLSIVDNAAGSPHSVPLSGTGVALAPAVSLSAASVSFPNTNVGATSAAQTVTVTNTGNANLVVGTVTLGGTNPGDFTATGCAGATVAPAGTCTLSVTFKPTAPLARSASVSIASNAASSPDSVSLSGTGVGAAASASPASLTFAGQNVSTTSAAQTVTLTNTGNANLVTGPAAVSLTGANPGDYVLGTNTCNNKTIAANATCTVAVSFRPTAPGTRTASLSIASNAAGSPTLVPLSGTGNGTVVVTDSLSSTSVGFAATRVNATSTKSITISNTGNANLVFNPAIATGSGNMTGANPAMFSVQSTTCGATLAPKGKCTVTFAFTPTSTGAKSASWSFASNATGSPQSVALSGSGK